MKSIPLFIILILAGSICSFAQQSDQKSHTYVDQKGVLRYSESDEEVYGFGVNYSAPFAHVYRSAKKLNIDLKEAIRNEVYHFKKLGFDLYRIHVWDTEISDSLGNLLDNEHLDHFDFLISELKKHDIHYNLTPIAFWGNGWPEPDEATPGFSHKYGKDACLTNPEAIKAQHNYLQQFLMHKNPYTGLRYMDDPGLILIEVSNEPHHKGSEADVQEFVQSMLDAIRKTGCTKPVFYNISHGVHFMENYFQAGIQGGTFQWYPTGLGYQKELKGNFLPNVDAYKIPFDNVIQKHKGAKIVYEFDAADIHKSYIYPAIARSFREAGIQMATHFAYDPTFLAYANTEYNTHYMNLVYTPQKALSLMIAGKVFHELPMNKNWGKYPENTEFGNFKVSYINDLAVYQTDECLIYTNSNTEIIQNPGKLKKLAGYGSSSAVSYQGKGAYFMDRLSKGIWRLEIMPDVLMVQNPYGRNSLSKTVSVINHQGNQIKVNLADLGSDFQIEGINHNNEQKLQAENGSVELKPGVYILSHPKKTFKKEKFEYFEGYPIDHYFAPSSTVQKPWLIHESPRDHTSGTPLRLNLRAIAPSGIKSIKLYGNSPAGWFNFEFNQTGNYEYQLDIPSDKLPEGYFNYNLVLETNLQEYYSFPADEKGSIFDWDFHNREPYSVRLSNTEMPVILFDARQHSGDLVKVWRRGNDLIPISHDEDEFQVKISALFRPDTENMNAKPIYDYSLRHFIDLKHNTVQNNTIGSVVIRGRSLLKESLPIQIAFIMDDGNAYGAVIELESDLADHELLLTALQPVKTVLQPRPYPTFLPYYFESGKKTAFDIRRAESIQISIGPGLPEDMRTKALEFGLVKIFLKE